MKILVVGGAGYIGSHMIKRFQDTDHQIEVLDNLSTGFEVNTQNYKLHVCDLSNKDQVHQILKDNNYESIMHFASFINVGESYIYPKKYYDNNVINTLNLLDCMVDLKISNFIFSSTAAVYGEPSSTPIKEDQNIAPVNPYGNTKAIVEKILKDYDEAYGLKYISLRYFNACGAHIDGTIGERHDPETHLIPLILQSASGRRKDLKVYGDDYDTKDGTCVRDYIHVMDLADAHLSSLEKLIKNQKSDIYNIGNNQGFSVKEIISMAEKVTQSKIPYEITSRRKGDPSELIADNKKISENLNWSANYSDLQTILETAWEWEKRLSRSN
jgi:UDP-glucose 4-epimerase